MNTGPSSPDALMTAARPSPHHTIMRLLGACSAALALLSLLAAPALAHRRLHARRHHRAHLAAASNPLAGVPWGVYTGPYDNSVYPFYQQSGGARRQLLAKIALRPLMFSFGAWYADSQIESTVQQYIASVTGGNPNVLA